MKEGDGQRLLAGALLQELLSLEDLRAALNRLPQGEPIAPDVLLQGLVSDGLLEQEALQGLESTYPGLLSGSAQATAAPAAGSQHVTPREGEVPKVLTALTLPAWRQYRSLRFLGEGGMGRLFKAFDASLRRMVALKFLRRTEPELIARFLLEAQHQAMVDHPNICRVYEVGEWQGLSYIAMQFIRGESLDVGGEALSLRHKVQVMAEVAEAVHAAHHKGLIHRDIKPANIMLEPRESGCPCPYVLDFGLARGLEETGLTVEGMLVGTFHFMSPEQAQGDRKGLSRRSDIYSLGATLYALLGGHPPFWEYEGMAVVKRLLEEDPTPLGRMVEGLPSDLATIVHKCLEKDPEQRYDSALALAEDLRRFLGNEPILARKPTLRYRMHKFVARHRALVAAGAVAAALLVGLAGFSTWSWATARTRAAYAQQYGQEAERLEAQVRYLRLLPAHDTRGELAVLKSRLQAMEGDVARAGRHAAGPGAYALGRGWLALGDADKALAFLERALAKGYRDPYVHLTLGRTQAVFYRRAMDRARAIPDAALRERQIEQARVQWGEPARSHLAQATSAILGLPELDRALLAFHAGRMDEALQGTRRALKEAPWGYEAWTLEGDILQAQAMAVSDWPTQEKGLHTAIDAFRRAQAMAPSDPGPHLAEAMACRHLIALGSGQPLPLAPLLAQADARIDAALALQPGSAEAHATRAALHLSRVLTDFARGQDPSEGVKVVRESAAAALADNPRHLSAIEALVSALATQGQRFLGGGDPLPWLAEAEAWAEKGLALEPRSVPLHRTLARIACYRFMHLANRGLDPWEAFEVGLVRVREGLCLLPRQPDLIKMEGTLWMERAQAEQARNIDPRSSIRAALFAYELAESLDHRSFPADLSRGYCSLIKADYENRVGVDPRADLESSYLRLERSLGNRFHAFHTLHTMGSMAFVAMEAAYVRGEHMGVWGNRFDWVIGKLNVVAPSNWEAVLLEAQGRLLQVRINGRSLSAVDALLTRCRRLRGGSASPELLQLEGEAAFIAYSRDGRHGYLDIVKKRALQLAKRDGAALALSVAAGIAGNRNEAENKDFTASVRILGPKKHGPPPAEGGHIDRSM